MLKNCVRRARAVSRASLRAYARRASAHTPAAPARDAARDDMGWIMNDAVLVCIGKMSARAYASGALRRHVIHIIHYSTRIASAHRYKPPIPLPFDWNKSTLASQS